MQDVIINEVIYHMPIINQIKMATLCKEVRLNQKCIDTLNNNFKSPLLSAVMVGQIPGKIITYSCEFETIFYLTTEGLYSCFRGYVKKHSHEGTVILLKSYATTTFIITKYNKERRIWYIGNKIGTDIYHTNFTKINVKHPLMVKQNATKCVIASIYGIHIFMDHGLPTFIKINDIINLDINYDEIIIETPRTTLLI
jgi:hypothetical protein